MPSIWMVLFLLVRPTAIPIREGLMPKNFPKTLMQERFAAHSTGGEVNRTFKALLCTPTTWFFEERG